MEQPFSYPQVNVNNLWVKCEYSYNLAGQPIKAGACVSVHHVNKLIHRLEKRGGVSKHFLFRQYI